MKNQLSLILATLQEALSGPQAGTAWGADIQLIEEHLPGANGHLWWLQATSKTPLLSPEEIELLANRGLLLDEGRPVSKRFGKLVRKAYGVLVSKLRKSAVAFEQRAGVVLESKARIKELEQQLRVAREAVNGSIREEQFLEGLRAAFRIKKSSVEFKFNRMRPAKGKANAGVPTLFNSDWHVGEVVEPERVNFVNGYNVDIAQRRIDRVFDTALEVLFHHQSGMSYEGMTLSFGGDMLSGSIHEELRTTNDRPVTECLFDLAERISDAIVRVAAEFPGVYVPAVSGNHGRIDPKSSSKLGQTDNYDYWLYRMVELQVRAKLGSKCNVEFDIPKAPDLIYALYSTRFLLTHGDQSNTSTNSDGFWAAMSRMAAQRQERVTTGRREASFEYMTVGHYHRYGTVGNVIVNGSLKGYCDWAYRNGFAFEPPVQALWITHPEHGITSHIPIYGEEMPRNQYGHVPPITTSAGLRTRLR